MSDKIEDKVLNYLSKDKVFEFLLEYKNVQDVYNDMKKIYNTKIRDKLKEIVGDEGIVVENDVFKVNISKIIEVEKVISINEARKLPRDIKWKVIKKGKSSQRMLVTILDTEGDDWSE